jgi:hypothetical protein
MKLATIKDAPGALNTNDKAMWVLGHNAAVETLDADAERVAASLREILNLCEIGDVDEDTEALGWGNAIKAARAALSACGVEGTEAPSLARWLTQVRDNRQNTERARGAALALLDELERIEPAYGVGEVPRG